MDHMLKSIISKFWLFGLWVGFTVATLLMSVFTFWNWLENPGGIFRDEAGTHWPFVFETAISWFLPSFVSLFVVASLMHLALNKFFLNRSTRGQKNGE